MKNKQTNIEKQYPASTRKTQDNNNDVEEWLSQISTAAFTLNSTVII